MIGLFCNESDDNNPEGFKITFETLTVIRPKRTVNSYPSTVNIENN